jgi:hypothetical protein
VVLTDLPQHCGNIARNCRGNNLVVQDVSLPSQTGVQSSHSRSAAGRRPGSDSGSESAVGCANASTSAGGLEIASSGAAATSRQYGPVYVQPHTWGEGVGNLSVGHCDIVILSELLHWPGTSLVMLHGLDLSSVPTDLVCLW